MNEDDIANCRAEYQLEYQKAVNRYLKEFTADFCAEDGSIDWKKLLKLVSG